MRRYLSPARIVLAASIVFAGAASASAQTKPAGVQSVGPWEAVQWVNGTTVSRCTLIRDKKPAGVPDYGFLTDREGILFSVSTRAWTLPKQSITVTVTPQGGPPRTFKAMPVSAERANVVLGKGELLSVLQREAPVEVAYGDVKVTLPFDDFNAARVVFESCVLNLGKERAAR